jgi:hypothetical protein
LIHAQTGVRFVHRFSLWSLEFISDAGANRQPLFVANMLEKWALKARALEILTPAVPENPHNPARLLQLSASIPPRPIRRRPTVSVKNS